MIWHLAFNTFLVFLVLAGAVELLLFLFGIKNARLRTILRLLPVIKLPLDLLVFGLFGESFLVNLNPLSCEIFFKSMLSGFASIPAYMASKMPPFVVQALVSGIAIFSAFKTIQRWFELIRSSQFVKKVRQTSFLCQRPITNELLKEKLEKQNVKMLISRDTQIPFAAGARLIVLPESLTKELSQAEFESIVSHELEHLRWKDPLVKFACNFICSFFWWIPTKWWMKRLEMDQEKASDSSVYKYDIEPLSLAQAFVKTAGYIRSNTRQDVAICSFASQNTAAVNRLEHILTCEQGPEDKLKWSAVVGFSLLAACSVWSC